MDIHHTFDQDLALKELSTQGCGQKPRFDWPSPCHEEAATQTGLRIEHEGGFKPLSIKTLVPIIGNALTDFLLSRDQKDIFNTHNQTFVLQIAQEVIQDLEALGQKRGEEGVLSEEEVYEKIEAALIGKNAYAVAKSLWLQRMQGALPSFKPVKTLRLVRRNQQVVPWNTTKIEIAVRKAFLSLGLDSAPAKAIAEAVTQSFQDEDASLIDIEETQNRVQEELMRAGYYKVAEAYILYRAHQAFLRQQKAASTTETVPLIQEGLILLQKEDGQTYFWNSLDLRKRIDYACTGLDLMLSKDEIQAELCRSLYPQMQEKDLEQTIILNAKALIEKDADCAKFAGRILLSYIYEEVLGWSMLKDGAEKIKDFHVQYFESYLHHAVKIDRLSARLLEYNLTVLAEALDPVADLDFDYLGIQALYDRYLIVDKTGQKPRRLETPQIFWMRVAMGLFIEEQANKEDWVIRLYGLYKGRRFCSSTPTLFNSGTLRSQLSSCFLYKVDDSIESIMHRGIAENAFLSKWAGGLGGSWTAVRGTGSYIKGTNGESQGVIPFLKLHNDLLFAVNQGGKRRGAGVAYLEIWHSDVMDFLELRKNTGDERRRTHEMNTAAWVPDLFMKRMEAREDWTLFHSSEVPDLHEVYGKPFEERYTHYEKLAEAGTIFGQKIPAIELWKKMLSMLFETGHPWITFKDPCNIRSPQDHAGVIHSSNLCTEITLNTGPEETAVCNLGSIVLHTHLKADGSIDEAKLKETIFIALRALDNVIDINFYPTVPAKTANMRHRPVGLGVMGLQNALYEKDIPFASEAALDFNDTILERVAYYAYAASSDLAAERGTYSSYKGSKWDRGLLPLDTLALLAQERGLPLKVEAKAELDWEALRKKIKAQGMRNSNVLAIAPTATISNIMGTVPCIEPAYKNLFVKSNLSGDFIVLNHYLVKDLKKLGLWNEAMLEQLKYFDGDLDAIEAIPADLKEKYRTAFDIPYYYIIAAAGRRQKWIDQSQSVNLFLSQPDLKTLSHMYREAFHHGLKTTYYLRTLGASSIEKATVGVKKAMRGVLAQQQGGQGGQEGQGGPGGKGGQGSESELGFSQEADSVRTTYSEAEKQACSLEAMLNGGTCEACQ